MSYLTLLLCAAILIASLAIFILVAAFKKCSLNFIITVCFAVIAIELAYFVFWPIPNYRFDSVQVKALNAASVEGGGKEVFIKGVSMREKVIDFPEVESGRWFWRNGVLSWRPPEDPNQPEGCTDTIVLKVPVGEERKIIFTSNQWKGLVEVTACGSTEVHDLYAETSGDVGASIPDSDLNLRIENAVMRVAVFTGLHIILFICAVLGCKYLLPRVLMLMIRCRYEAAFFAYAMMRVILYGFVTSAKTYLFQYSSGYYINSFEFGFIKRGLLGQLFMSITPYIAEKQMLWFLQISTLVCVALIAVLLGRVVRRQKNEVTRWFLVMMVCAFPSTFMFVSDPLRPDIYTVFLLIACAAAVLTGKALWAVPICVVVLMLINETSCAYLIPPVLAMLLYKWSRCEKGKGRKYMMTMAASFFITAAMAGMMLLSEDPRVGIGADTAFSHIQKHAGYYVDHGVLSANTWPLSYTLKFMAQKWAQFGTQTAVLFLVILPGCILLAMLWVAAYRKWNTGGGISTMQKICILLMALSGLGGLIPMVFACDFGRYFSFLLSAEIIMFFFFLCEERIQLQLNDVSLGVTADRWKRTVPVLPIAICMFYILYGTLNVNAEGGTIARFIAFFKAFLR